MITHEEGRLRFDFPETWTVLKYDDSPYYRRSIIRSGAGLAAVDFVAAPPARGSTLVLLEVKDFREHALENRTRLTSGELAVEVITKALDTFGALHTGLRANQPDLRPLAPVLQPYPNQVQVVLLLEEDPPPQAGVSGHMSTASKLKLDAHWKRRGDVLATLQSRLLPFRMTAALYSCAEVPARAGWTATPLG